VAIPEQRTWESYWHSGSPTGPRRQQLIRDLLPLVQHVARQTHARLPCSVELDDLVGYWALGLIHAVDRFQPIEGGGFLRYATICIRGSILEGLRTMDWAGASRRQWERSVQEAVRTLSARLGRRPELDEIAAYLDMSLNEFHLARQHLHPDFLVYLEDLAVVTGEGFDPLEVLEDPGVEQPEDAAARLQEIDRLEGLVSGLPPGERAAIRLFHLEWFSTQSIARVLNVSQARVYQHISAGVERLRKRAARARPEPWR